MCVYLYRNTLEIGIENEQHKVEMCVHLPVAAAGGDKYQFE